VGKEHEQMETNLAKHDVVSPTEKGTVSPTTSESAVPARVDKIEMHPALDKYIGNMLFLFEEDETATFFMNMLEALIQDHDARTFSEQMLCVQRAKRMLDDLYYQKLAARIVDNEKRPAVEEFVLKRATENGNDAKRARELAHTLAEKAHVDFCDFDMSEWEAVGWGTAIAGTEAHRRALPALTQLDRIMSSNLRAQTATLKELELLKRRKKD
jgi:hypothetical protein